MLLKISTFHAKKANDASTLTHHSKSGELRLEPSTILKIVTTFVIYKVSLISFYNKFIVTMTKIADFKEYKTYEQQLRF